MSHSSSKSIKLYKPSPVSTIHHAAGHVFAMTWIAFHHHRGGFEDGHRDLRHRELLMVGLLRGDHRSIGGQHEVDARIGHQIGLEPDKEVVCWFWKLLFKRTGSCRWSKKRKEQTRVWPKRGLIRSNYYISIQNWRKKWEKTAKKLGDVNVQCTIEAWSGAKEGPFSMMGIRGFYPSKMGSESI